MDGVDCSALDVAGDDATAALSGEVGFVIGAGTLGVLSLLLLLAGEALVRVLSAAVAGGAAAGSLYLLTDGTDCATRLWLAAGAGVAGAALVLCLLGSGFFVLGAGGFGAVAHYVYVALPTGVTGTTPAWSYYAAVGGAALAGGRRGAVGAEARHAPEQRAPRRRRPRPPRAPDRRARGRCRARARPPRRHRRRQRGRDRGAVAPRGEADGGGAGVRRGFFFWTAECQS